MAFLNRAPRTPFRTLATQAAPSSSTSATASASTPRRPRLEALRADKRGIDDFLSDTKPERVLFTKSKQLVPLSLACAPSACVPSLLPFGSLPFTQFAHCLLWSTSPTIKHTKTENDCLPT
ncbi:hypothetical protein BCR35DRAFT_17862 [Leucosporidium creatinivorum]|uniref:Uncharacterized protein n=1 Tax=Leucosporidium creatinivorum TaxID=106004 RepID=A0A1Y2D278_9BASI|nr:hypothetical protein BCR35DRAFT_17862 [Leucosporidium creatinivorum]